MSLKANHPLIQHQAELNRRLPMTVERWRALKGMFYVLLMGAVATVGILEARVWVPLTFIIAALLIFGVEVREIQIADVLSMQFNGRYKQSDDSDDQE